MKMKLSDQFYLPFILSAWVIYLAEKQQGINLSSSLQKIISLTLESVKEKKKYIERDLL